MKHESWQRIFKELSTSCVKLFRENGVELVRTTAVDLNEMKEEAVVAFIGFSGEHIRGSVAMFAPTSLIMKSHPMRARHTIDVTAQCDWARELANQIVGLLQNRLLHFGIEILLSMPSAAIGRRLRTYEDGGHEGFAALHLDSGPDCVLLVFDAIATEGTELSSEDIEVPEDEADGQLVML